MSTAEIYQRLRPLMFSIAYRMLGSVSEAEDIVQEAFLRYHAAQPRQAEIGSPKAYLSAVTTRLCIDHLRSARARRKAYPGEWLPEPLLTGEAADPPGQAEQTDSLSMAFLLVLERLSPVERAVFLLHDVFSYGYEEIARIVGKSEDNCRQLGVTARPVEINGQPGAMYVDPAGHLTNVFVLDIADGQVQTVRSVINPAKLRHLGPLADMADLRRQLHPQ